ATLSTLEVEELFFSSAASVDGRRFSIISWWPPSFSAPSVFSTAVVEMVERVAELEAVELGAWETLEAAEAVEVMEGLLEGVEELEADGEVFVSIPIEVEGMEVEDFSIPFSPASTFSLPWRLHPPPCWRRRSP